MDIDLSTRLAEYRKQNKLSQEALAEKLGLSRQAVSKWERGESSPDTVNLIALSRIYGVTIDELLGNSAPAHNDKELYNDRPPLKVVDGKTAKKDSGKEHKEKPGMKERREKRKQVRTEKSAVRREMHEKEAAQKQTEKAEKQAAKMAEKAEKENAAEIKKAEKDALKKEKQNEKQQKKNEKDAAREAKKAEKESKKKEKPNNK